MVAAFWRIGLLREGNGAGESDMELYGLWVLPSELVSACV
jgi:hypothetical protein